MENAASAGEKFEHRGSAVLSPSLPDDESHLPVRYRNLLEREKPCHNNGLNKPPFDATTKTGGCGPVAGKQPQALVLDKCRIPPTTTAARGSISLGSLPPSITLHPAHGGGDDASSSSVALVLSPPPSSFCTPALKPSLSLSSSSFDKNAFSVRSTSTEAQRIFMNPYYLTMQNRNNALTVWGGDKKMTGATSTKNHAAAATVAAAAGLFAPRAQQQTEPANQTNQSSSNDVPPQIIKERHVWCCRYVDAVKGNELGDNSITMRDFLNTPGLPLIYKLKGYICYSSNPVLDIPALPPPIVITTPSKSTVKENYNPNNKYPIIRSNPYANRSNTYSSNVNPGGGGVKLGPWLGSWRHLKKKPLALDEEMEDAWETCSEGVGGPVDGSGSGTTSDDYEDCRDEAVKDGAPAAAAGADVDVQQQNATNHKYKGRSMAMVIYEDEDGESSDDKEVDMEKIRRTEARIHYLQIAEQLYSQCLQVYTAEEDVELLGHEKAWLDWEMNEAEEVMKAL